MYRLDQWDCGEVMVHSEVKGMVEISNIYAESSYNITSIIP